MKKQAKLKWLSILEGIVFYFAILNIISHMRGPTPYRIDTNAQQPQAKTFSSMTQPGVNIQEDDLWLYNPTEGMLIGYSQRVELKNRDRIRITFRVDCPASFAGNTLIVDLFDDETEYDSPEQEQWVTLQPGINEITVEFVPEDTAPDAAELRIFTTNSANYRITEFAVYPEMAMKKITPAMMIVAGGIGLTWISTVAVLMYIKRREL